MRLKLFHQPDTRERKTFVLEQTAESKSVPKLICTTTLHKGADWVSDTHSHDFLEVMLVVGGSVLVTFHGKAAKAQIGDVVIYNRGEEHSESALDPDVRVYYATFTNVEITGLSRDCATPPEAARVYQSGAFYDNLKLLFDGISDELCGDAPFNAEIAFHTSQLLFLQILRLVQADRYAERPSAVKDSLRAVLEYIDENFARKLTLAQIADYSHLNKFYIEHMFSKHKGVTLNRYITNKRVAEAGRLLRETDLTSKSIAELCGFADANYFSYVFRKTTGKTPGEYRASSKA